MVDNYAFYDFYQRLIVKISKKEKTTLKSRRPDCPVSEVITQAPSVGVITKNLSHVGGEPGG